MILYFLGGHTPLTKKFYYENNELSSEPYPFVRDFTSYSVEVHNLEEFHAALIHHAQQGHCLIKGQLTRELNQESRAGSTNRYDPTPWICLDLDFEDGFASIDEFVVHLGPEFKDTSYIFQHSASAGVTKKAGLRGHLFMMLERPLLPDQLKVWLQWVNLTLQPLRERLSLSINGVALKWPLDITTCQADKLLYIAPPMLPPGCEADLPSERCVLVTKTLSTVDFTPQIDAQRLQQDINHLIHDLRERNGLERKKLKMKEVAGSTPFIANPDAATITGVKQARGYVYLNLNGGDSWAYYFPEKDPSLLRNFKGEPPVRLRDIAPDFFAEYVARQRSNIEPFAIHDPLYDRWIFATRDQYGNINHHSLSARDKFKDAFGQYNLPMPEVIPDWRVEFDPTNDVQLDDHSRFLNLWKPTEYMINAHLSRIQTIPPIIKHLVTHVFGNHETLALDYFINWLAYRFQTRKKTIPYYLLHGCPGTGKGVLFGKVIAPLFGRDYVASGSVDLMSEKHNSTLTQSLFYLIDECEELNDNPTALAKLKHYSGEDNVLIRAMRTDSQSAQIFVSFMLASNHDFPYPLEPKDRRCNVGPPQKEAITLDTGDMIQITRELDNFASFLAHYPVCETRANAILETEARQTMMDNNRSSVQQFFDALHAGDLDFFLGFMKNTVRENDGINYPQYDTVLRNWIKELICLGQKSQYPEKLSLRVTRDDLQIVYSYLQAQRESSTNKFTRMCGHKGFQLQKIRIDSRPAIGAEITWVLDWADLRDRFPEAFKATPRLVR